MMTVAPARAMPRAIANPKPRAEPVTSATLPVKSNRLKDIWDNLLRVRMRQAEYTLRAGLSTGGRVSIHCELDRDEMAGNSERLVGGPPNRDATASD